MRVDPKRYLARQSGQRLPPADMSAATLGVVALEISPLLRLAGAPCVAEAVGALTADVQASQSASSLSWLRGAARRWRQVRPDLRAFYEDPEVHGTDAGDWGLKRLLSGWGTAPGPKRGELDRLWIERHGAKAPFSLIPKVD